jgi:ABC-type bacteriocin transporter
MILFNKYKCIRQHDINDCGVACLATVCREYGLKVSIGKIRQVSGTDKEGTSAYGIIKAAESLGFTAKGVIASNPEEIFQEFPKPAIAHVIIDNTLMHYVVIHRVSKEEIVIADPAKGVIKYKSEDFLKIWTGVLIFITSEQSLKKCDETKGLFERFWGVIKPQRKFLGTLFISSILITILGIIGSFYFRFLIDDILPNNKHNSLMIMSMIMIGIVIFKITIEFFRSLLLIHMSQNMDKSLLLGYYNHVIELPMSFFGTRKVGDIISRFNDGAKIRDAILATTLTIMIDTIMAIIGGGILYIQNHKLFVICFVPIALYLILVFVFKKALEELNRSYMQNNAELTSYLVESIEGIETVKAFNGERKVNLESEKKFVKLIKSIFKYSYVNNIEVSLMTGIKAIFGIVILWLGGHLVLKGEISIGVLISFNVLLSYFIEPMERIISLQPQLQSAIVAADRLGEILEIDKEKSVDEENKIIPKTLLGDISLKSIYFRYGTKKLILNNINMYIKQGEKVALVGESGSGKTTIAKLLMNFYNIEKGEIIINNHNIKDISKEALRNKISYISQDSFFFSGTVIENLQFANKDATYQEIIAVCEKVHIHEYIMSLPLKYETLLEEKGANLSGGQRQRLSIARAILKKPEILIMDEATSNLDSITERAIERTIEDCTKNVTTIIIAHRLSTIMKCDKIYVMDKGEIIEFGSHEELIRNKGYYYNLWKGQSLDGTYKYDIDNDHSLLIQ